MTLTDRQSQAQFDIVYEGPAVAEGSMNVRDLAPAMLGVGAFFEASNRILNGDRALVNVNVRATSAGSFEILFEVLQNLEGQLGNLLANTVNLKQLLVGGGGVGGGIIALIKWLRGRKPRLTKVNDSLYTFTLDGETYEVPLDLLRVYQDATARRAIEDMVRPVKQAGIERLRIREQNQTVQQVTQDDVVAFDAPDVQELLLDEVSRHAFSIISLAFKEENKWRLTDGENTFSVSMADEAFQRRVANNEVAFSKGDVLVCDLRTIQWQIREGVKTEYEVVGVVSHRPARQLSLFEESDEADT